MNLKKYCTLVFLVTITFVCNGQNAINGKWYLHEVQIPSTEEYSDNIRYDKYECMILVDKKKSEKNPRSAYIMPTQDEIDAFERAFLEFIDDTIKADEVNCEEILYNVYNDTILVLYLTEREYDIYVVNKMSKDLLIISSPRTIHGLMKLVFGRTKQHIKHVKHTDTQYNQQEINHIVNRISPQELSSNITPAAVTYNFVNAILNSDTPRMLSFMDANTKVKFETSRINNGFANYDLFFSVKGSKLNILGWKPYLLNNCEIAVTYVQSEWFDERGREVKKVYVSCVSSSDVGHVGFQEIKEYGGTNVKVLVAHDKDGWKVVGFK